MFDDEIPPINELIAIEKFGEKLTKAFKILSASEAEAVHAHREQFEDTEADDIMHGATLNEIKYHYSTLLTREEINWRITNQLTITRPLLLDAGSLQWMSTGHMRIDAFFDEMQRRDFSNNNKEIT